MNAALGVTAGANITKLIRAVVAEFAIAAFFIIIFAVAGVKTLTAGDATPVQKERGFFALGFF